MYNWKKLKLFHHSKFSLLSSCSAAVIVLWWSSWSLWLCCSWLRFLHLIRRFWNHTLTWPSVNRNAWARYKRSGPTMYCCRANSRSSRSSCSAVKIVLTLLCLRFPEFDWCWLLTRLLGLLALLLLPFLGFKHSFGGDSWSIEWKSRYLNQFIGKNLYKSRKIKSYFEFFY